MKKEELKQKAEEYALEKCKECYMCNSEENGERGYCPKFESRKEGYIEGAKEEREKIYKMLFKHNDFLTERMNVIFSNNIKEIRLLLNDFTQRLYKE